MITTKRRLHCDPYAFFARLSLAAQRQMTCTNQDEEHPGWGGTSGLRKERMDGRVGGEGMEDDRTGGLG